MCGKFGAKIWKITKKRRQNFKKSTFLSPNLNKIWNLLWANNCQYFPLCCVSIGSWLSFFLQIICFFFIDQTRQHQRQWHRRWPSTCDIGPHLDHHSLLPDWGEHETNVWRVSKSSCQWSTETLQWLESRCSKCIAPMVQRNYHSQIRNPRWQFRIILARWSRFRRAHFCHEPRYVEYFFHKSSCSSNVFLLLLQDLFVKLEDFEGLLTLHALQGKSNQSRLKIAFLIAEKEFGIYPLLDPEDVDVSNPDEKSVMTYVAQFLNKFSSKVKKLRTMFPIQN